MADSGDLPPLEDLVPLVYDELHEMAHWQLLREHRNVTLQTTALVHEAFFVLDSGLGQESSAAARSGDGSLCLGFEVWPF